MHMSDNTVIGDVLFNRFIFLWFNHDRMIVKTTTIIYQTISLHIYKYDLYNVIYNMIIQIHKSNWNKDIEKRGKLYYLWVKNNSNMIWKYDMISYFILSSNFNKYINKYKK